MRSVAFQPRASSCIDVSLQPRFRRGQPIDPDKPLPIREWQQKYERYLDLIARKETRKRYARALERFLGKHPGKTYAHQFLRPIMNDYVETRLSEGASIATVRLEMSAVRGLFQFMLDMGAADVFFNPAEGVKVKVKTPFHTDSHAINRTK